MTDNPKMKPCPFCGEANSVYPWLQDLELKESFICCNNCGATGPITTIGEEVEAWNRALRKEVTE